MKATELNIWVLGQAVAASSDGVIRRLEAASRPHIRRCLKAGLIEQVLIKGGRAAEFHLTDLGREILSAHKD